MAELLRGRDLSIPVRTCPGRDPAGLTAHTGAVHRWATAADLMQVVWGRRSADHYAVEGDAGLLARWRERAVI
ncbi:hypothetical protein [Streptosporangium roseum]|uniref:hypothetical protein n=1 Tax=Streptosporangium roseum TaxID=2001 RepID=UPI0033264231